MHKLDRYLVNDIHIAWVLAPQVAILVLFLFVMWQPDHGYEIGVRHALPDPVTRVCYAHQVQGGGYCEDVILDVSKISN